MTLVNGLSEEPSNLISQLEDLRRSNPNLQPLANSKLFRQEDIPHLKDQYDPGKEHLNEFDVYETCQMATITSSIVRQRFWKYHIIPLGRDQYYLTTNPNENFINCRPAPGIYAEIKYPSENQKDAKGANGFQLVFRTGIDQKPFMKVTQKVNMYMALICRRLFYKSEEGMILQREDIEGTIRARAQEIEISEVSMMEIDEISIMLHRYEVIDQEENIWTVGSMPVLKSQSSTKLKNKRYIYFNDPQDDNPIACFRPCEQRRKKKLINKVNRASTIFRDSIHRFDTIHDLRIPKQPLFSQPEVGLNSVDDDPDDTKLGWITIFDNEIHFKKPGFWEMVVGYTLAAGINSILEEERGKLSNE